MSDFAPKDKSDTAKTIRYSERLYHATLQSISDAIFVIEPSTRTVVLCNPASEKIFGYKQEEIIGRNTELIHVNKEMYEEFGRRLFPALDKDGVFNTEFKMKRKDGTVFFTENTVTEIVDDSGRRTGVVSVVKDITGHKTAEKLLKESEERYKSIFNNNKAIMLLIDPETANIVDANGTACSFYGYTKERLTSMKISDINILSQEEIFREMENAKSERRNHFIFRHRLASGEIRDVEIYSGPVKINGKVHLISIIHDISEHKKAERILRLFKDLLDKSNDSIFINDAETSRILDVNETAQIRLGYTKEELQGMRVIDIEAVLPDEFSWKDHMRELDKIGFMILEGRHKRKNGTIFPVEVSVTNIQIEDKKFNVAIVRDITERKNAEETIKVLRGFIPICASCKKIRNDKGYWEQLEAYITDHSEAVFSHGICPECAKRLYPDLYRET